MAKKHKFLKFFFKVEAGHVLKMFLSFGQIGASRSYKKKTCIKYDNLFF